MYELAYQYVIDRYYNKRAIIAEHFRDLLDLPAITLGSLRETLDKINAIVRGIKTCGLDTAKMSPLITYIIVRKLPEKLRTDWENSNHDYSTYPSFDPLAKFLNNRCFAYETVASSETRKNTPVLNAKAAPTPSKITPSKSSLATAAPVPQRSATTTRKCACCGEGHFLSQCPKFESKSIADRYAFAESKNLCKNCLRFGHFAKSCNSSSCRKCGERHHTMLHRDLPSTSSNTSPLAPSESVNMSTNACPSTLNTQNSPTTRTAFTLSKTTRDVILLPSAVVKVRIGSRCILARALIDSCSQVNLVTESFVRKNRLMKRPSATNIVGVSPSSVKSSYVVSLTVESRYNEYQLQFDADVIGRIPYEITPETIKYLEAIDCQIEFADRGLQSTEVDILISAEYSSRILLGNKKFIGELCLEDSKFGWIAAGPLSKHTPADSRCCCLSVTVEDVLSKFWEVDEVTPPEVELPDHELCERHFETTHTRLQDGRFQVRLPFKKSTDDLANTYYQARSALLRFESRADASLRSQYIEFMKEYRDLGHMKLAEHTANVARYFIPHLPVLRPDSTTTKLRVVFNASATTKGKSNERPDVATRAV